MSRILVVANETVAGRELLEAVRQRARQDDTFVLVVPRNRPRHGAVVYDEAVRDAAQVRVDLAVAFLAREGIDVIGEVGDGDPYGAAMDAIAEHQPRAVIVSTHPETTSGWLRRDLVGRIERDSGLPVQHVVNDIEQEGRAVDVTLVVANHTAEGEELIDKLQEKDAAGDRQHIFIVVMPLTSVEGPGAIEARKRLGATLETLRGAGLVCSGMVGDPDPYTATRNALQFFRADDVVISTLPAEKSGWLRADLVGRVKRDVGVPVEHVVVDLEAARV